ncbi:efflux transporter outer membrane subunit [Sphingomonadaceae bacterium jetA1]|jgi:NodT family efflux transporter outer membrane factor (OMF) lipoprotein|uniref:efflux transporter outer membrane subunit n=1 Tax=Facivitalis istanbulensis TaxID=3075838 RepID=UPI00347EA594
MTRFLTLPLLACVSAGLSGCAVGPHDLDAHASLPPLSAAPVIAPASGPAQSVSATVAPEWWHAFGNTQVDALVTEALAHNNDVAAAEASLRQAREQALATKGSLLFPQGGLSYNAQRTRVSNALSPAVANQNQQLYTLHTAQVSISYNVDTFGGNRAQVRSAKAQAAMARHQLDAARMTIAANLVTALIERASLAEQVAAAKTAIAVNRDILSALQQRQRLGAVGAADVATQQAALATAEGALPPLVRAEAAQRTIIATLLGRAPGSELPALPELAQMTLPTALPAIIPSELVHRRPDVLAAEAQLQGAGADVGAAIAARLPSIQLSANAGGTAQDFGNMFKSGNPFWALLGGITQPLFHANALRHQQKAAEAALEGAKAQYRSAVLQAFGDVADSLTGLSTDAQALEAAQRASNAAGQALTFARRQLALGDVGTLQLLNATATDAQARAQMIQARAARMTDTVALFQAAGGPVARD